MAKSGGVSGAWFLEGLEESGPEGGYMADPSSGTVYIARSASSWPEPVGWLADTGNVQRADMDVNAWCKQLCAAFNDVARVKKIYYSVCTDSQNALGMSELQLVVSDLMFGASHSEIMYLVAILCVDPSAQISLQDLLRSGQSLPKLYETVATSRQELSEKHGPLLSTLHKLSKVLIKSRHAAEELFSAYDMDGDGTLDPLEILYLYKAMLPTMTPIQVKLILIYMQLHDIVGVAEFQYRALLQMFRAVPVHMPHGCHPGTFNTLTSLEPSALSHRKQRGKSSVQSSTSKPGDGLQSTVFLLTIGDKGPMAIFSSLAAVLQSRPECFEEIFEQFDEDNNGVLSTSELQTFVATVLDTKILPEEAHSIKAILDVNGDGNVSREELTSAITDMQRYQAELLEGMEGGESIELLSKVVTWICDNIDLAQKLYKKMTPKKKSRMLACSLGQYVKAIVPDGDESSIRRVVGALIRRMQGFATLQTGQIVFRDLVHGARDVRGRLVYKSKHQEQSKDLARGSNRAALKELFSGLNMTINQNPSSQEYRRICSVFTRVAGESNMAKEDMIPERELERFLSELLGPSHELEFKFFKAMMMRWDKGPISRNELFQSIKDGWAVLQQPEVARNVPTIHLMISLFQNDEAQARAAFNSIDLDGDGCITPDEIADVVKGYNPKAKRNEIRSCIAVIQALDVDRNGFISFEELKEGMLSVLHEDVGSQGANADPLQYQEKMIQLVRAMQYRMKVDKVSFDRLFGKHANANGILTSRSLQHLLREVLGRADISTTRYFEAMLDINGDGTISSKEFLEAITEAVDVVNAVAAGKGVDSADKLQRDLPRLAGRVLTDRGTARAIYDRCDSNADGHLEPSELRQFICDVDPTLGSSQIRMLLAYFQGLDFNHDGYISFEELIAGLQALTANEDASTPYGSSGQRLSSSGRAVSVDRASPVSPCLSSSSILRSYSSATGIPKHPELLHEQSRPSIVVEDQESTPVPADQRKGIKAEDADCSVSQVPGDPILHDERSTTSVCRHEDTSISIQDGGTSPTVPSSANVPTWRNDANSPRHSGPPIPPIPLLDVPAATQHTFGEDLNDIMPRLQEIEHRGRNLMLDPKTRKIYVWQQGAPCDECFPGTSKSTSEKWADQHLSPKEIGRLTDESELQITETDNPHTNRLAEMYNSMYLHMKEQRLKFQDVFYAFDHRCVGTLDRHDLQRFLQHLLGHLRPGELDFFHSAFEPASGEDTTLHGIKVAMREVSMVADTLYIDHKLILQAESLHVLNRLSHEILQNEERAKSLFRLFSREPTKGVLVKKGCMNPLQVPALVKSLIPELSDRQIRFGVAHVMSMDRDCDGVIGFGEYLRVVQACRKSYQKQLPSGTLQPGWYNAVAQEADNIEEVGRLEQLRLEEFAHNGLSLLVEPFSQVLYQLPKAITEYTEDTWPQEIGYLTSNNEVRFTLPVHIGYTRLVELHQELSRFMQEEELDLMQVFKLYGISSKEGLEFLELCKFLQAFLRDAISDAELVYLHAMLDLDGSGIVSYNELSYVLDEVSDMVDAIYESEEDQGRAAVKIVLRSMLRDQEHAKRIFMEMDSLWKGTLPTEMIAPFLRSVSPSTSEQDLRYAIAQFARLDHQLGSHVTFKELLLGLSAAVARRDGNRNTAELSCASFTALRKLPDDMWMLDTFAADGLDRHMLLDRDSFQLHAFRHMYESPMVWVWEAGHVSEEGVAYVPAEDCSSLVARRLHHACSLLLKAMQEDMGRIRGVYEFYASAHPSGTMQLVDLGSFLEETVRDDLDGVDIHLQSVLEARERQGIDLQSMQEALGRVITMCEGHTAETNELSLQESCVVEQLSYELNCHSDRAMALFRKYDHDRRGWLFLPDATAVIMELVPGFLPSHLEVATVLLCFTDVDLSGTVTVGRLLSSFRIAQIQQVPPAVGSPDILQAASEPSPGLDEEEAVSSPDHKQDQQFSNTDSAQQHEVESNM